MTLMIPEVDLSTNGISVHMQEYYINTCIYTVINKSYTKMTVFKAMLKNIKSIDVAGSFNAKVI